MKKRPTLAEMHENINSRLSLDVPEIDEDEPQIDYSKQKLVDIPIEQIEIDKNIRDAYADASLEELGDSIIENGQIQPIIVTKKGDKYVVKVGHRRYKACLLRDVATLKCIVEDDFKNEKERIITQAIENEQRLNLSSREREAYIAQLIDLGLSQIEIARALHKSKGWVSEALTSYKFVNENQGIFEELSEEPSTRDTWKASTLSKEQLSSAIEAAKEQGGTKEAFKKEIGKRYQENSSVKKKSSHYKLKITQTLVVDPDNKIVTVLPGICADEELESALIEKIQEYYETDGYTVSV